MLYQKGATVFAEIHDQPRAWREVMGHLSTRREELTAWFKTQNFGQVIYLACSDSLNMASSASRVTHLVSGLNSVAMPASEVLFGRRAPYDSRIKTLVLALARPDEAEEVAWAIQKLRTLDPKAQVMVLHSGEPPQEGLAHQSLTLPGVQEESKIGTRSVSSLLLAALVLVSWLSNREVLWNELQRLPDLLTARFKTWQARTQQMVQSKPGHVVFLGSGPYYGIASQAALTMREMAGLPCDQHYFLEYRYGAHVSLTNLMAVVGLISNTFRVAEEKVLGDLAVTRSFRVALIEEATDSFRGRADEILELKSGVSEISRVLLMLPALQLMAFYAAVARGINPDHPKHLEHQVLKLKERPGIQAGS